MSVGKDDIKKYNTRLTAKVLDNEYRKFAPLGRSSELPHTSNIDSFNNVDIFKSKTRLQRSPPPSRRNSVSEIPVTNTSGTINVEDIHFEKLRETPAAVFSKSNPTSQNSTIKAMTHNVTIKDAQSIGDAPRVPKFVSPTVFDPATSNVISFLKSYDEAALLNRWDEKYKIAYFGCFLKGVAQTWYDTYISDPANESETWAKIKSTFMLEFGGESHLREIKLRLQNRKQGATEDIKNYFFDVINNQIDGISDERIIEYFENGLHPLYYERYALLRKPGMTIKDLKEITLKLSELHQLALMAQMNNSFATFNVQEKPRDVVESASKKPNVQNTRTRDGRPICFRCGKIGHTAVSCYTVIQPPNRRVDTRQYNGNKFQQNHFRTNNQQQRRRQEYNFAENSFRSYHRYPSNYDSVNNRYPNEMGRRH